jgi:hypothetical protein
MSNRGDKDMLDEWIHHHQTAHKAKCKKKNAKLRKSSPHRGDSAILIFDS